MRTKVRVHARVCVEGGRGSVDEDEDEDEGGREEERERMGKWTNLP